ncbi:MAG: sulfotransferase [Bacteroidetes bacterium]|nr:sulfotransferase [Bacteroidota bacterium]
MSQLTRIFIVGYMHSGTTLLQSIISSHSSVFSSRGETNFYKNLSYLKKQFPLSVKSDIIKYIQKCIKIIHGDSIIKLKQPYKNETFYEIYNENTKDIYNIINTYNHENIFIKTFDYLAKKKNSAHWLEKTPTHLFHLDFITSLSCVKIFNIIRDPRDVLSSKKKRKSTVYSTSRYSSIAERKFKSREKTFHPVWDAISWNASVNAYENYKDDIFLVKYENLVCNPEETVRKICSYLELNFESQMLAQKMINPSDDSLLFKTGIKDSSVNSFKNGLNKQEIYIIQQISKGYLGDFGYVVEKISLFYKIISLFIILTSPIEFITRVYKRYRIGGKKLVNQVLYGYLKRAHFIVKNYFKVS